MHPDELNKPLGLDADAQAHRREIPWAALAFGGLAVLGAGVFAFARLTDLSTPDPAVSLASIAPAKPVTGDSKGPGVSYEDLTASIAAPPARASGSEVEESSGVRVVRQGGASAPGALIISVPQALSITLAPAPDRRLVENARVGQLPKIGADGAKPMNVYARPVVDRPRLPADAPRLGILIGGMGLNAQATSAAISRLPADVTLGFAPYGAQVAALAAKAREKGHETILQTPMEGFGGQAEEPGPHVLRTGASPAETLNRLHWHMSRFQGYAGIAGFMGARFTAEADAFRPVMRDIAKRGLFYFDDGGSPRSLAASLAAEDNAPLVRADVSFDGKSGAELDGALVELEKLARERGSAVGYGTGAPIVIGKVSQFAQRLEARGIMLAPVSALARVPEQTSANAAR